MTWNLVVPRETPLGREKTYCAACELLAMCNIRIAERERGKMGRWEEELQKRCFRSAVSRRQCVSRGWYRYRFPILRIWFGGLVTVMGLLASLYWLGILYWRERWEWDDFPLTVAGLTVEAIL